jgi:hypothetical protein
MYIPGLATAFAAPVFEEWARGPPLWLTPFQLQFFFQICFFYVIHRAR